MKTFGVILTMVLLAGCNTWGPDPGHEIVLVKKPWIFGHGGVVDAPITTGRTFGAVTTSGIDVYMQPEKHDVEMDDTMTKDGVPIDFHAIMVLQVTDSVRLIKEFGEHWYDNNLMEPFRTMVRQAVRKRGMNETAISTTALDEIDAEIHDALTGFIKEKNLPIKLITMTVGRANPPDSVKHQRIETATQEQRIQTEQQTKLAEDQRKAAQTAKAEADNAYQQKMGLSPEQFVQLKQIEMMTMICGPTSKTGCTFISNGATPVYNLAK